MVTIVSAGNPSEALTGKAGPILAMSLIAGALLGCAAPQGPDSTALIAPDIRFAIPGPGDLGYSVSAEQLVTAHFQGQMQVFEAHLSVGPDKLTFVGLDPLGRRALTVTDGDAGLVADAAPWLPQGLNPANILSDIAIVYWPEAALRRGLAGTSATLEASPAGRSILAGGKEIIHVDYPAGEGASWNGSAHYRNIAFGYELDLQSKRVAP